MIKQKLKNQKTKRFNLFDVLVDGQFRAKRVFKPLFEFLYFTSLIYFK